MADVFGFQQGQQTVDFSVLVKKSAEASFSAFKDLCAAGPELSDTERKIGLLKFINKTRQRLLRLLVLARWCGQMPLVECCQQLVGTLSNHDTSFIQAADSLFFLHEGLQQARAPMYDIPSAVEVLLTGSYRRLPKCIEDLGMQPMLVGEEKESTLQKLDTLLRSRLLDIPLPREMSAVRIANGRVTLRVNEEFEAHLTLGYRGNPSLWRVLHLQILVGEGSGRLKLTGSQEVALRDDLERRMAALEDPFQILFSVLHEFCTAWVMDTIIRQVRSLRQGRWKDAIRFEIIQEGSSSSLGQNTGQVQGIALDGETDIGSGKPSSSPALKIAYWLDLCKGNDLASVPSLRIKQGPDHNVACSHVPSVIDPVSNLDAQFQIHLDSVDVERLLLSAIQCNIHTRLREVERCLKSNSQLYRVDTDVVLRTVKSDGNKSEKTLIEESGMVDTGEVGEEVLCVRAYGKSYLALGMNIRIGRFVLRSINTLIASATLKEIEDDLNAGLKNPVDAFITLRNKSLLHLYASIGTSLKLKPFEKGALVFKVPADSLKLGPDALIMGFPNCGERFFLALQLDSSFMPVLTLLEAQLQSSNGQNSVLGGSVKVVATLEMPYHTIAATEDEVNFSLFDGSRVNLHHKDAVSNVSLHGVETDSASNALGGTKRYETLSGSCADGGKSSPAALENWPNPDADKPFGGKISFSSGQMYSQSVESGQHGSLGFSSQTSTTKALPQNSLAGKSFSGIPGTMSSGWSAGVRQPNLMPAVGSPGATGSPSRNTSGAVGSPSRNPSSVLASPSRGSTFQRGTLGSRQGTETETLLSKSPLNPGDTASSPINLDDDDLSKLIDTIASKSTVSTTSGSNNFEDGVLLTSPSRQARMATPVRGSPLYRSSVPSSKPSAAKSSVPPGSLSRNPVLSPGGSAHTPSPARRSPVPDSLVSRTENPNNVLESSEMTEHPHPSLGLSSPTKPVPSPMPVHSQQINSVQAANSMDKSSERKRKGSDIIFTLPILQGHPSIQTFKKRKLECETEMHVVDSSAITTSGTGGLSSAIPQTMGQTYPSMLSAANQGEASMYTYTAFLLQATRRCNLCIKYSRLLSQMFSCGISCSEEIGYRRPSSNMWFRLPKIRTDCRSSNQCGWELFRLCLGKPGSTAWEVRINDDYFKELYELQHQKGLSHGAQVIASEADSHIQCTSYGLILMYESVEDNSIQNMLADLERLWNARVFALGIKQVLEVKGDEKGELTKLQNKGYTNGVEGEKIMEIMRKASRIEAVGLTSVWFSYTSSVGSVNARFVVEWERGKKGCTVHVSPDQLWPHTKYLEEFINAGEIELLLSCIRATAGPLHSLASAVRPARMPVSTTPIGPAANAGTTGLTKAVGQVLSPSNPTVTSPPPPSNPGRVLTGGLSGSGNAMAIGSSMQAAQTGAIVSGPGRGTGLVPSSLLPTDVSVVLRSPYWIRIFYRRQFAVDMRCFSGDQVWLQPAPPPQGSGPGAKGSLPCPQFRPFVLEQITACYNSLDSAPAPSVVALVGQPAQAGGVIGSAPNLGQVSAGTSSRVSVGPAGVARPSFGSGNPQAGSLLRVANTGNVVSQQSLGPLTNVTAGRSMVPGISMGFHPSHRELNAAGYGYSDDGGYGGVWVPLAFLKKVLRGTLRYLGVVWLFAQFPGIIKEVLASHLKETEGALLNHDPETPALRFFIRNCVFAVSVHRQQLVLQAINVKRYQNQPQQQQQQQQSQQTQQPQVQQIPQPQSQQSQPSQQSAIAGSDNDLSLAEMQEIGDFFARRAAFEPYDASRLASFVTMLTLPVPVLREFIVLIAWKKDSSKTGQQIQVSDPSQPPRPKLELCLENRSVGVGQDANTQEDISQGGGSSSPKSSIHYDRSRSLVEFTLTVIFETSHVPHINVAGGAGWLPQCIAVRLRYMFGEGNSISLIGMEGSHGGRACWSRIEDWERCKEKVARAVEVSGGGTVTDQGQGRLQAVAETIQTALQSALQQLRRGTVNTPPMAGAT